MILRLVLLFVLLQLFFDAQAQLSYDYVSVEQSSLKAYAEKDWVRVIEIGENSIEHQVEFYALDVRMGVAYYHLGHYRSSIKFLEKAMKQGEEDLLVLEYLVGSYWLIGDDIMAIKTLTQSQSKWAQKQIDQTKIFRNIYAFYTYRNIPNSDIEQQTLETFEQEKKKATGPFYLESYDPQTYRQFHLGTGFRLANNWQVNLSYQNFSVSQIQRIYDPFKITSLNGESSQNQWQLHNRFALTKRMKLNLFATYISIKYDYIQVSTETVPPEFIELLDQKYSEYVLGLSLSRRQTYFDLEWQACMFKGMGPINLQTDLAASWYPFANASLWGESRVSIMLQGQSNPKFAFKQSANYWINPQWSVGVFGQWGDMRKWVGDNGYTVYNGIYGMYWNYQFWVSWNLNSHLQFKLYYEYSQHSSSLNKKSLLPEDSDSAAIPIQEIKFNTHSITGGLIWTF